LLWTKLSGQQRVDVCALSEEEDPIELVEQAGLGYGHGSDQEDDRGLIKLVEQAGLGYDHNSDQEDDRDLTVTYHVTDLEEEI
jgi:hypothetical protein